MTVVRKTRSTLVIGAEVVRKTFRDTATAAAEIGWYQRVPWACPELLDADPAKGVLVIAKHPVASRLPDYRPVAELLELLHHLELLGIHHRDIHTANIVAGPGMCLVGEPVAMVNASVMARSS